jgi:hypothetical protein
VVHHMPCELVGLRLLGRPLSYSLCVRVDEETTIGKSGLK